MNEKLVEALRKFAKEILEITEKPVQTENELRSADEKAKRVTERRNLAAQYGLDYEKMMADIKKVLERKSTQPQDLHQYIMWWIEQNKDKDTYKINASPFGEYMNS